LIENILIKNINILKKVLLPGVIDMALQIRRGTNAERQSFIPLQGEIIFTTDTKKLYVGDGTTTGGIAVDTVGEGSGGATYSISAETTTGGANLRLTGSDSSIDNVKLAAGSNVTISRTDDSTITISAAGGTGGSTTLEGLEDVAFDDTPTAGQVLTYDGVSWVNENFLISLDDISNVSVVDAPENSNLRLVDDVWLPRQDLVGSKLTVNTSGNNIISLEILHTDNNISSGIADFIKSRGTIESKEVVLPGDDVFSIQGRGYDGTEFYPVAAIKGSVDPLGTVSTGIVPGSLALFTTDSSGILQKRLEIDKDGLIYTTGVLGAKQFYIYSDDTRPYSLTSNHSSNTSTSANQVNLQRSRGSDINQSIVLAGDTITNLSFRGFDGSSYRTSSAIVSTVDPEGTVSSTAIPGKIAFLTAGNNGTLLTRAELDKDGKFTTYGQHWGVTGVPTGLPLLLVSNSNVVSDGARSAMRRSRGTFASPTAVVNGDKLFRLLWGGHDGSAYIDSAGIEASVSAAVSTGIIPTELAIRTTNSSGVLTTAIKVTNNQVMQVNTISSLTTPAVNFSSAVTLANYATAGARDTAIPSPQPGTVVYITDTGKFQGYNGLTSTWNELN
jgi:hypothetical protein